MKPHQVAEINAPTILRWLNTRGGILIWKSHDLGSANLSVTTPLLDPDMKPVGSPGWKYPKPDRHITSAKDVEVCRSKVVEEFTVKLKVSGMKLVLTNSSDARVKKALARHGDTAHYRFGATGSAEGSTPHGLMMGEDTIQILIDDKVTPLPIWAAEKELAVTTQAS